MCQMVISKRINEILKEIKADNYVVLTTAMQTIIHDTPNDLCWEQLKHEEGCFDSPCFHAISTDNKLYSINVMTGIVLVDGQTTSTLPSSIYTHKLYIRTFGDRRFDIYVSDGVYTTITSIEGCIYSFRLNGNDLIVHEIHINTGTDLLLLEDLGSWGIELPVRLRQLHSHWYCSNRNTILLREINFCQRNTDFVIRREVGKESWVCFRIPLHNRKRTWDEFVNGKLDVSQLDKLMNYNAIAKKLEKFEDVKYIHTFVSSTGIIKVQLPRYRLTFELRKSEEDGIYLETMEFVGYRLSSCQQLEDTLMGFKRYFVLEHGVTKQMRIVIPVGDIQKTNEFIDVDIKFEEINSQLDVFAYDIHPRLKNIEATSISARLQLAELYTATSSLLPESRMNMTGEEIAMKLVRQCWSNKPMTKLDYVRLQNISHLSRGVAGLRLLCFEVERSSFQCAFLHPLHSEPILEFPNKASTLYLQETYPWNIKSILTTDEEYRVFGRRRAESITASHPNINKSIPESDVEGAETTEELLKSLLVNEPKEAIEFFLDGSNQQTILQSTMMGELQDSFQAYNETSYINISMTLISLLKQLRPLQEKITTNRFLVEEYLLKNVNEVTNDNGPANKFRMLRTANISPILQLDDLMIAVCSLDYLRNFNPFLSEDDLKILRVEILKWMKLCVLEDKLYRLCMLCQPLEDIDDKGSNDTLQMVIKEINTFRTWSVEEHPEWLIFEVLGQLQIRPLQYSVANSIINGIESNAGPIVQLNMGEGKTRVIMPMLILHWRKSRKLIRLNFLPSLMQEAFIYLQQTMCSGVFDCKLFLLPFSRDVCFTEEQAKTMYDVLTYCQMSRGILFVTPGHRMSLQLKWYELHKAEQNHTNVCKILQKIDNLSYIDILDECDEILRVKKKLVYACGTREQLISGDIRWQVAYALLKSIKENTRIQELLSGIVQWKQGSNESSEAFKEFRIIDGKGFKEKKETFYKELLSSLIDDPPYALRWAKALKHQISLVVDYVTNPESDVLIDNFKGVKQIIDVILTLRGYLANGLLAHCLMKRNRVEYGIKHGEKKRMAVPFHACETPAPRAEFSHHDCAIIYTLLAYYYDGLKPKQVIQAFKTIMTYGSTLRDSIYDDWYQLSEASIKKGSCVEKLDRIDKIDLSDKSTVTLIVQFYQYNIGTIHFWLHTIVFPIETMQYPYRLEATSWDIGTNNASQVAGFSGTNDEKMLTPSSLSWIKQEEIELKATDGKMLQLIAKNATFHVVNNQAVVHDEAQWKQILDTVIQICRDDTCRVSGLIDAGALMAGASSTEDVATYILDHIDPAIYKGVVYFDKNGSGWHVIDNVRRTCPKHLSPIHERDAFVYFDESRCRGADMKLRTNSKAVLTLGPNMLKDKLMQAAGRMRQLEHEQKVIMIALYDVTEKICEVNSLHNPMDINSIHVLKWVLNNTLTSVTKWLPEWAIQGGQYALKQGNPNLALISDVSDLSQMYADKLKKQLISDVWQHHRSSLMKQRMESDLPPDAIKILKDITERICKYGIDSFTHSTTLEGECERQLEKEIHIEWQMETEKEIHRELPTRIALFEKDWNINLLSYSFDSVTSPVSLNEYPNINVYSLDSLVQRNINYEGKSVQETGIKLLWPSNIYATENFFFTCKQQHGFESSLNDYLRLVNSFLVFPNGDILLISERESDKILKLSWYNEMNCVLVNLTYIRLHHKNKTIKFQSPKTKKFDVIVEEKTIAALQLFHGDVTYKTEERRDAVKEILKEESAKSMAPMFPSIRGLADTYQRSHLEDICTGFE